MHARLALRGCPSVAISVFTVQVKDVLEGALASGQDVVQTVRQLLEGTTALTKLHSASSASGWEQHQVGPVYVILLPHSHCTCTISILVYIFSLYCQYMYEPSLLAQRAVGRRESHVGGQCSLTAWSCSTRSSCRARQHRSWSENCWWR